jgi:hypothetical protein
MRAENAHAPVLWAEVQRTRWRRSNFQVHAGGQGVIDHSVARIQRVADEEAAKAGWGLPGDAPAGEVVICCGDGQFRSSQIGNAPAPNKRILHAMRQRHRVLMVNEAYTTAYDYDTELPLKRVWSDGRGQVVRGLLWCDNSVANINNSGSCFVSRDGNAARNMRWIVERGGDNRPSHLVVDPERAAVHRPVGRHIAR